jgi:iron complex transport system substrate-binding protein
VSAAGADLPPPQRIVSANLCTDRLVLALVERDRVAAVSRFAADPVASTVAAQAAGLAVTTGEVEDILARAPDLVVLGAYNATTTAPMLRQLGIQVHVLAPGNGIAETLAAIRALARDLDAQAAGEALVATIETGLAAQPHPEHRLKAAIYQAGGWSAGRGTTADDLLHAVGMDNIAADAGFVGFASLPLETLAAADPDLIVVESMGEEAPSISGELLHHPALVSGRARRVTVPMRLWACPDAALIEAAALIAGAGR